MIDISIDKFSIGACGYINNNKKKERSSRKRRGECFFDFFCFFFFFSSFCLFSLLLFFLLCLLVWLALFDLACMAYVAWFGSMARAKKILKYFNFFTKIVKLRPKHLFFLIISRTLSSDSPSDLSAAQGASTIRLALGANFGPRDSRKGTTC